MAIEIKRVVATKNQHPHVHLAHVILRALHRETFSTRSTLRVYLTSRQTTQLTPKCRDRYRGSPTHRPPIASLEPQQQQSNAARSTHRRRPPLPLASMNSSAHPRVPILVAMQQRYTRLPPLHRLRLQSKSLCDRAGRLMMAGEW